MAFACCGRSSVFATLSRAAAKYAGAIARRAGAGTVHYDWPSRATVCERCPMRILVGNVSYCGQPVHRKPVRDPAIDGCGCPTREKARSPEEHCPFTAAMTPARADAGQCDCKWCAGA